MFKNEQIDYEQNVIGVQLIQFYKVLMPLSLDADANDLTLVLLVILSAVSNEIQHIKTIFKQIYSKSVYKSQVKSVI